MHHHDKSKVLLVDGSKFPVGVVREKLIHAHSSTYTSPTIDITTYPVVSTVQCTEVHTHYHVDDTIPIQERVSEHQLKSTWKPK